jgi:hypothetical protein
MIPATYKYIWSGLTLAPDSGLNAPRMIGFTVLFITGIPLLISGIGENQVVSTEIVSALGTRLNVLSMENG